MKAHSLLSAALLFAAIPALAHAETIASFNAILTSSSLTEFGRPSRSGTQQTWIGAETYTGVLNSTTAYAYTTYTFAASLFTGAPYLEISVQDTLNTNADFVTAYAGSYNINSRGTGWLGDEGSSGNYFNNVNAARYFDVILPVGQNLVLVLNDTAITGLNDPININIGAYADSSYDEPAPATVTPEPSSFVLLGTGLLGLAGAARRRLR